MRTIKFRGKDLDTNEWVYGDLLHAIDYDPETRKGVYGKGYIIHEKGDENDEFVCRSTDIYPDTVGQFTGFYDRKRKEIYEGDIITYLNHRIDGTGFIEQGKVEWRQVEGCYVFVNRFTTRDNRELVMPLIRCKEITVIGNIYDNPELLKGGEL